MVDQEPIKKNFPAVMGDISEKKQAVLKFKGVLEVIMKNLVYRVILCPEKSWKVEML